MRATLRKKSSRAESLNKWIPSDSAKITHSALEGLAKRELNLSAILGKSAEAKERRLVPEVVEDFFLQAAPVAGLYPKEGHKDRHVYRVGRFLATLWPVGERLEPRFGKLGREYKQIIFDKNFLTDDPTLEWVTPGHPLFECCPGDALGARSGGPESRVRLL